MREARKSSRWALGFFVDVKLEKDSLIPYTVGEWGPDSAPDLYVLAAILRMHKDRLNNSLRAQNNRYARPATPPRVHSRTYLGNALDILDLRPSLHNCSGCR